MSYCRPLLISQFSSIVTVDAMMHEAINDRFLLRITVIADDRGTGGSSASGDYSMDSEAPLDVRTHTLTVACGSAELRDRWINEIRNAMASARADT